jgi:hypothetical protein
MKRIIAAMFCCALIAGSAAAQKRQAGSHQRQASLTIEVNIVPAAASPLPGGPHSEAVTYNIPVARLRLSVTEKIQEEWVKNSNGDAQLWVVKTITVVPE